MALTSWSGAAAPQAAQSYIDVYTPGATDAKTGATTQGSWSQQAYVAPPVNPNAGTEWAEMAARMAPQQQQYATIGVQGSGPAFAGGGGGGSSSAGNTLLSQLLSGASSAAPPGYPAPPTAPTMPAAPNFSAAVSGSAAPYNAQLQQLIAQLQGQANESNGALQDRAAQQIAAQRAVLDRRAASDVTRSLAANGLLPTGGQAARMRQQISQPYEDQLTAATADINAGLQQQRGATANNLLSSLASIQNASTAAAADQQRLAMQQQQNAFDQQMAQYNAQVRANETAYQRQMDAYQLQQQQQAQQLAQQQARQQQSAYQQAMSGGGGGSMTGSVTGWNGGANSFLESGLQPEQLYQQHLETGRRTNGQVGDNYYSQGNQDLRAQQAARAAQVQRNNSVTGIISNAGNGLSSAGSSYNPNDPFGSTLTSSNNFNTAMGGGYGAGGGYGTGYGAGGYSAPGGSLASYQNGSWGSSMY